MDDVLRCCISEEILDGKSEGDAGEMGCVGFDASCQSLSCSWFQGSWSRGMLRDCHFLEV